MPDKPKTADAYDPQQTQLVRAACLTVAVDLADLMDDVVIVGGLVPSLLIDQADLPEGADAHPGTMDLDVGLSLAVLDQERYTELAARLRGAGFMPDTNGKGNKTVQRWIRDNPGRITVDFLMPVTEAGEAAGTIKHLDKDLGALVTAGLNLGFQDRTVLRLTGQTLSGETATRTVAVVGPGAYVVLKAIAFARRAEPKDAFDLYYVIRNYGDGVEDVASHLTPLLGDPAAQEALKMLERDFTAPDSPGAVRAGTFLFGERNADTEADVVGFVTSLLALCGHQP